MVALHRDPGDHRLEGFAAVGHPGVVLLYSITVIHMAGEIWPKVVA